MWGLRRRGLLGTVLGLGGLGLAVEAISDITEPWKERLTHVTRAIEILAPVDQVFNFCSNLENARQFMPDTLEVKAVGEGQWRWRMRGPLGGEYQMVTQITNIRPDQLIVWKTAGGSIQCRGRMEFEPSREGTGVRVSLRYWPPGGRIGALAAKVILFRSIHRIGDWTAPSQTTDRNRRNCSRSATVPGRTRTEAPTHSASNGGKRKMKAIVYHGVKDVRVEPVADPEIVNPHDAIVKISSTAICGSDLHLYHGFVPAMVEGDILGHEFMGTVEEIGPEVKNLKKGDRVVVPFAIACGRCFFCRRGLWSQCDNTNPNAHIAEKMMGYSPAGLFGYSHLFGGYPGLSGRICASAFR